MKSGKTEQRATTNSTNQAKWIWYPGDLEIWLGNRFNNRRTERGAKFPPFWKQDSHWITVEFSKSFCLKKAETIRIWAEGSYNLMLDGKLQFGQPATLHLPAGEHRINLKVHNLQTPPALLVQGNSLATDASWLATYEDKIWIDENGVSHGSGIYVPAACGSFDSPKAGPSSFALARTPMEAVSEMPVPGRPKARLFDFGRETMGYLVLENIRGRGQVDIYYGESAEEALDSEHCETLDKFSLDLDARRQGTITDLAASTTEHWYGESTVPALGNKPESFVLPESKAFRYICVETTRTAHFKTASLQFEYLPQEPARSGSFRCSDEELNRIWDVSAYTLDLTTREFFMDGIKRDRWTWSGDAIQSYLMNYYLRFDLETVKRTIRQLRGKDPVTAHVNTIMDYSFYWFQSVLDYYRYSGDIAFVREMYPRMATLMDYCLGRALPDGTPREHYAGCPVGGLMEGRPDDWIFVDWVDFPMHKRGVMSFEQLLFAKSLETMAVCAELLRDHPLDKAPQGSLPVERYAADAREFRRRFAQVREHTDRSFWDDSRKAYLHNIEEGRLNPMVTKFPNMMAVIFGYADAARSREIREHVLLNPDVEPITTPYMRFYELEALCALGMQDFVLGEMKSYWGGMLQQGATTFWEKYIPSEQGREHLQMYGRPYGKSLCHAWGASPIYLIGKYFLGVRPLEPGYDIVEIRPVAGGLEWMEGSVPTPKGLIKLRLESDKLQLQLPCLKAVVTLPAGKRPVLAADSRMQTGQLADGTWQLRSEGAVDETIGLMAE